MELAREIHNKTMQNVTVRISGVVPDHIKKKFFVKLKDYGLTPFELETVPQQKSYIMPRQVRMKSVINAAKYLLDAYATALGSEALADHKKKLESVYNRFENALARLAEKYGKVVPASADYLKDVDAQLRRSVQDVIVYLRPIMSETLRILDSKDTGDETVIKALDTAEQYYLLTQPRSPIVTISNICDIFTLQIERVLRNFDDETYSELGNIRNNKALPSWFEALSLMQQTLLRHTLTIASNPQRWAQVSRLREIPGLANFAESLTVYCEADGDILYESKALRSAHPASRNVRKQPFAQTYVERSCGILEAHDTSAELMLLTLISPLRQGLMLQGVTPDSSLHENVLQFLKRRAAGAKGIHYAANLSLNYGQYLAPSTNAVAILRDNILARVKAKFPYIPAEERDDKFIEFVRCAYNFTVQTGEYFPLIKEKAEQLLRTYEPSRITQKILDDACRNMLPKADGHHACSELLKQYIQSYPLSATQEKIVSENLLVAALAKACEGKGGQELPTVKVAKNVAATLQGDPDAHNLHLAARFLILAELVGIIVALTCVSGKDRTALVLILKLALMIFFQKMGYSFNGDTGSHADKETMAAIVAQLYANQHHAKFASQNAPGAFGIKHIHKYLPSYYVEAIAKLGLDPYFEDALASMNDLDKLLHLKVSGRDLSCLTLLKDEHCRRINDKLTALLGETGLWGSKGRDINWSTKLPEGVKLLRALFRLDDSSSKISEASPLHVLTEAVKIALDREESSWSIFSRADTTSGFYRTITSIVKDFPKEASPTQEALEEHVSKTLRDLDAKKTDIFKVTTENDSSFGYK